MQTCSSFRIIAFDVQKVDLTQGAVFYYYKKISHSSLQQFIAHVDRTLHDIVRSYFGDVQLALFVTLYFFTILPTLSSDIYTARLPAVTSLSFSLSRFEYIRSVSKFSKPSLCLPKIFPQVQNTYNDIIIFIITITTRTMKALINYWSKIKDLLLHSPLLFLNFYHLLGKIIE